MTKRYVRAEGRDRSDISPVHGSGKRPGGSGCAGEIGWRFPPSRVRWAWSRRGGTVPMQRMSPGVVSLPAWCLKH